MKYLSLLIALMIGAGQISLAQKKSKSRSFESMTESADPFIEEKSNGSINWTDQYIEAKGESVIDTARFKNPSQANAMASRGAVVVAQRNLLEIVEGVHIQGETTVRDMIVESDMIRARVDGVLKNAQVVNGPAMNEFGLMEVTMRVPLYEGSGLASAVIEKKGKKKDGATEGDDDDDEEEAEENDESSDRKNKGDKRKGPSAEDLEMLENLVFEVTDGKIDPSLFPKITDIDGNTLLDLMDAYDSKSGRFPRIVRKNKDLIDQIKDNPKAKVVELIQDEGGNLVADGKGREILERVKNTTVDILGMAKSIILF
jgi:hypothetical protein